MPRGWGLVVAVAVAACAGWAVLGAWQTVVAAGSNALGALWLVPALMVLHLVQLLLSSTGWRQLLIPPAPGWLCIYRLRLVREGVDSLLPVAQVGGEVVGAQLLARQLPHGVGLLPSATAAASVVVDVTIEFLTQLLFLLCGLAALAIRPGATTTSAWAGWVGVALLAATAAALLLAQRLGVLRLVEALARQIAIRWPALVGVSLDGLHDAAARLYRRRGPVLRATALHLVAWALGTLETWIVLHAVGAPVTAVQALVVESLGMAARSAGFAVPGALVVQETGFVLAAAAAGVPEAMGLSLSVVKRVREIGVGLIGLALWRSSRRSVGGDKPVSGGQSAGHEEPAKRSG